MDFRTFYNQIAESYEKRHNSPATNYLRKKELGLIRRFASGRILDIGCGTGYHMQHVENAVGVDISEEMLKIARKRGLDVKKASAENLPFRDSSFDTVFCFFTVLNICDYKKTVKEMARVLKPGGVALLSLSSVHDNKEFGVMKKRVELKKLFKKEELIEIFESNGFKLEHLDSIFRSRKPRWGDFTPFTLTERIKLFLDRFRKKLHHFKAGKQALPEIRISWPVYLLQS